MFGKVGQAGNQANRYPRDLSPGRKLVDEGKQREVDEAQEAVDLAVQFARADLQGSKAAEGAAAGAVNIAPITAATPLPKVVTLQQIVETEPLMQRQDCVRATRDQIDAAVASKNFFELRRLLNDTITHDWHANNRDPALRDYFQLAASRLWVAMNRDKRVGFDEQLALIPLDHPGSRHALTRFVDEAAGFETWRIHSDTTLENLVPEDAPAKLWADNGMALVKLKYNLRVGMPVPGEHAPLTDARMKAQGKDVKFAADIASALCTPEFGERRVAAARSIAQHNNQAMAPWFDQARRVYEVEPEENIRVSTLGPQCAGKTTHLKLVGIDESRFPPVNCKKALGTSGSLPGEPELIVDCIANHDGAAGNDAVRRAMPSSIDPGSNLTGWHMNNVVLKTPEPGTTIVIVGTITSPEELLRRRAAMVEGRRPAIQKMAEEYDNMVARLPEVIAHAERTPGYQLRLADGDTPDFQPVVVIVRGETRVLDADRLAAHNRARAQEVFARAKADEEAARVARAMAN